MPYHLAIPHQKTAIPTVTLIPPSNNYFYIFTLSCFFAHPDFRKIRGLRFITILPCFYLNELHLNWMPRPIRLKGNPKPFRVRRWFCFYKFNQFSRKTNYPPTRAELENFKNEYQQLYLHIKNMLAMYPNNISENPATENLSFLKSKLRIKKKMHRHSRKSMNVTKYLNHILFLPDNSFQNQLRQFITSRIIRCFCYCRPDAFMKSSV